MASTLRLLISVLSLVVLASSKTCFVDDVQVQPNFDFKKMVGRWYELKWAAFSFVPVEFRFRDYGHYYYMPDPMKPGFMAVDGYGRPGLEKPCFYYTGSLEVTDTPGKLLYTRPESVMADAGTVTTPYWIVATDYENYAVTYGCPDVYTNGTCNPDRVESWVWGRRTYLNATQETMVAETMERICMKNDNYLPTEHEDDCLPNGGLGRQSAGYLVVLTAFIIRVLL